MKVTLKMVILELETRLTVGGLNDAEAADWAAKLHVFTRRPPSRTARVWSPDGLGQIAIQLPAHLQAPELQDLPSSLGHAFVTRSAPLHNFASCAPMTSAPAVTSEFEPFGRSRRSCEIWRPSLRRVVAFARERLIKADGSRDRCRAIGKQPVSIGSRWCRSGQGPRMRVSPRRAERANLVHFA